MKRLTILLFVFIPFIANAQTAVPIVQGSKYYQFRNAVRIDSALFIPRKDTIIYDATLRAPSMLTGRPQDSLLYYYTGSKWLKLITDLDTTSLSTRIDAKLNISDTASMLADYLRKADTTGKWKPLAWLPVVSEVTGLQDSLNNRFTRSQSDQQYLINSPGSQLGNYNVSGTGNVQGTFTAGTRFAGNLFSNLDTIYFFGNSITLGSGASPSSNRFSDRTSAALGNSQRNYGIGSSLMQMTIPPRPLGARSMIDTIDAVPVKVTRGRVIVIAYGLNDIGCNQPDYDTVKFKTAYRQVLDTAAARGWNMNNILIVSPTWVPDSAYRFYSTINGGMGVPTRQRHLDYVDACRAIAQERGTMYINMYQAMLSGGSTSLISADSLHPNNAGHQFMADTIARLLKSSYFTGSNSSLYVDSNRVTTNASISLNNNASTISNAGNNFLITNNLAAFTKEIAMIHSDFSYGSSNYWGWHISTSALGQVYFESVGSGSQRARPVNFGITNPGVGTSVFMRIDTTGRIGIGNTSPTSTLHVSGSISANYRVITGNNTAASELIIYANNTGTATISLPPAADCTGRIYIIKKISANGNDVVIDPNASEQIDGASTKMLTLQYSSITIHSSGANWFIMSSHAASTVL